MTQEHRASCSLAKTWLTSTVAVARSSEEPSRSPFGQRAAHPPGQSEGELCPFNSNFAKRGHKPGIERPQGGSSQMGEHKASNAEGLRLASYLGDWRMAAHLPNEPNGSVPAGPFGEQQIGTRGPAWKSEELWSPRDRATWRPEEIPEGRMRRVNDGKGHNPELAARDGLNPDLAP